MSTENTSRISRRSMLRTSGALVAGTAVLAACAGSVDTGIARIGETPELQPLDEASVSDAVLLRTAMSVEKMVSNILSDERVAGIADAKAKPIVTAYVAAHTARLGALSSLVTANGGQPDNEPNKKLMAAYGDNVLELMGAGKKASDVLPLTHALESLVAATYQYFVALTNNAPLRSEMMRLGAQASRRAAVAAQLISSGIKSFDMQYEEDGTTQLAGSVPTFSGAFGALNAVQVQLGPDVKDAPRANVLMDTPSLNSMSYPLPKP
jgi:hypothetical protein